MRRFVRLGLTREATSCSRRVSEQDLAIAEQVRGSRPGAIPAQRVPDLLSEAGTQRWLAA